MERITSIRNQGIDLVCTLEEKLRQLNPTASSSNNNGAAAGVGQPTMSQARFQATGANSVGGGPRGSAPQPSDASGGGLRAPSLVTVADVGAHVWKVGKHRILSTTGLLEETVDNDYYDRVKAATQSKSLLFQIENEFKSVIGAVNSLSTHYDTLLSLLEKFRATCDDQLARDADAEALRAWGDQQLPTGDHIVNDNPNLGGSTNGGISNGSFEFVMVSDPPPQTAADPQGGASNNNGSGGNSNNKNGQQRYRITPVDAKLASLRRTLIKAANDLKENVQLSCQPISLTTRSELDTAQTRIIADVTTHKTHYDLTRHKAHSRGIIVVAANSTFAAQLASSGNSADVLSSSASAIRPTTSISLPSNPTEADYQLRDDLWEAKKSYDTAITSGKKDLHFLLEQTSMSTWACYNVFFQQMANYYGEVLTGNSELAKVLVTLKNQQSVAQQLTAERKAMLERRTQSAEAAAKRREREQEDDRRSGGGGSGMIDLLGGPTPPSSVAAGAPADDFGDFNAPVGGASVSSPMGTSSGVRQPQWGPSARAGGGYTDPYHHGQQQEQQQVPQGVVKKASPKKGLSDTDWDALFE